MKCAILVLFLGTTVLGRKGFGPTEQEWGYVTVRENAHMFWWLHQTSADVANYTERPLVLWLQGGPGGSSTGYGNFAELGPLDVDLNPRNTTWIKDYNVLFVDNPVGCGFSYVDTSDAYVTNNTQIADDFLVLIKGFYEAVPELKSTPLFIFSESYGGKMAAEIALVVDQAIKNGEIDIQLVGIGLGDAAICLVDSARAYGTYLLSTGVVDHDGYKQINETAEKIKDAADRNSYLEANDLMEQLRDIVENVTDNVDFYNILTKIPAAARRQKRRLLEPYVNEDIFEKIDIIMNTQVKQALGLNVTWGIQSDAVADALYADTLTPVTKIVEHLLNSTYIQIAVYNGQLDLIINMLGTTGWIEELNFDRFNKYKEAERKSFAVNGIIEGYYKKGGNLAVYWVNRSGHMVPVDNTAAMSFILSDVINASLKNTKN